MTKSGSISKPSDTPDPLPEETRSFWREMGKNMIHESIGTIDETSKQLVAVTAILEGLYFHAIAFSSLHDKVSSVWYLVLYLLPIGLLLISLSASLLVFFPNRYRLNFHSSEAARLVYEGVIRRKLLFLKVASAFLVLSIISLFVVVLLYLRG
jgi:hypothetical protein